MASSLDANQPDALSVSQWKVLLAIADTVVAELTDEETQEMLAESRSNAVIKDIRACREFAKLSFSSDSRKRSFPNLERVAKYLGLTTALRANLQLLAPEKLVEIGGVLDALDSHLGSLVLTRTFTVFSALSRKDRELAIKNWYGSRIAKIRSLPRGLVSVMAVTFARNYDLKFLDYDTGDYTRGQAIVNRAPNYEFLNVGQNEREIFTDVLVIGSGSGGGVAAATLAKAGNRVLVVEKSSHHSQESFPMTDADAAKHLYENSGVLATDNNSMTILAGSTFGGGSTINWSASLQTPANVRNEWATKTGVEWFRTPEFQHSLDFVCDRMGVSDKHIRQNFANSKLLEGSKKLGQHAYAVPQNTGGSEHYCGHCPNGCRNGDKLGGLITWLADAREAGAQFLKETLVKRIIIKKGVATGALVLYNGRELIIHAKKVIMSAGTLNTPCILKQSGLRNGSIGKNLKLHPCSFVIGHWEAELTRSHEGGILTAVGLAAFNRDGKGHGAYLEVVSNQPGLHAAMLPWRSALDWKKSFMKYPHSASYISLTRDKDCGFVYPDPVDGKPTISYLPSAFDRESILEGVVRLCDVCLASGADEITTAQVDVPAFRPNKASKLGIYDPAYKAWIEKVRSAGIIPGRTAMGSAHQMGTCAIGTVCDENAKVLGVKNLWIADASVFPTSSGVNPMVTTMALAHRTALKIIEEDQQAQSELHQQFAAKI